MHVTKGLEYRKGSECTGHSKINHFIDSPGWDHQSARGFGTAQFKNDANDVKPSGKEETGIYFGTLSLHPFP